MRNMPRAHYLRVQYAIKEVAFTTLLLARTCFSVVLAALLMAPLLSAQAGGAAPPKVQLESGRVAYVVDGDTIWVKTHAAEKPLKVRLAGIDAPEICQAGGAQARDLLRQRLLGQTVTISYQRRDDYGRVLARVSFRGDDVGRWMVGNGQAWSYRFRRSEGPYAVEEAQARRGRRGIFAAGNAENPRSFRQRHGSCHTPTGHR
jgi:micrococcal nuclease